MSRGLIVTADDFGMSVEVNEAVEAAHRNGVLTCASLVVAGDAAEDALRRARRLPGLGVGLHLALFCAPAAAEGLTPPLSPDGRMLGHAQVATGVATMLSPRVRRETAREMAAQFEGYRLSGLALGHLDGHWHCHQHPAVLAMALDMGKAQGLRAVRVPFEGWGFSRGAAGAGLAPGRLAQALGHWPLAAWMRRQVRRAGMRCNDAFFGKCDAGAIGLELLLGMVDHLPVGVTELGLHPAMPGWSGRDGNAPPADWRQAEEVAALTDPALRARLDARGVRLMRWADLA
jgi:hopanoid biosynthesis associated protein HpnK